MRTYYNKSSAKPAITEDPETGLIIKIRTWQASFSIGIYKGRNKMVFIYRSPYQRKYQDYKSLSDLRKMQELSEYESISFNLLESEEKLFLHEYKEAFESCLKEYPKPSYPVASL